MRRFVKFIVLLLCFTSLQLPVLSSVEKIEGLEHEIRIIEDVPIGHVISKRFDLYEIYFENRSEKTF